jgi:transcriptional regulator GlxA family with amidase domain
MNAPLRRIRVSLLATPESLMGCLTGLMEMLVLSRDLMEPGQHPFDVEIVARSRHIEVGMVRMPLVAHRTFDEATATDVVIIPSITFDADIWKPGQYPGEVQWLRAMRHRGAILCSTCSGALLLADAGLLDGEETTSHWILQRIFRELFPKVCLRLDRELIVSRDERLVMSGASTAWYDLVLYLISRYAGPATAQALAKFMMVQWHADGQTPYLPFEEPMQHGDRAVKEAQLWLREHWRDPNPVEGMIAQSRLSPRNFARRFRKATGLAPLAYVQRLRIERAKQMMENTPTAIDEISAEVGYEDASFFRRIFKRTVGLKPVDYRRRFCLPVSPRSG